MVGAHLADAIQNQADIELDLLPMQPLMDFYAKSFRTISDKTERQLKISEHLNTAALARIVEFKPDLVLVMALAPISPWLIDQIKQLGVKTAHWYIENFRYFPANPLIPKWQIIAPHYDYFFTIQKGAFFEALQALGAKHFHHLPTGCNPRIHQRLPDRSALSPGFSADISFVGSPYPNRIALFQDLPQFDLALWGPGWSQISALKPLSRGDDGWISSTDECKILNSTKIALNVHSSLFPGDLIEQNDFLNPRVFTIAACGAFQLVDESQPLAEVFEIGSELAVYRDLASLKEQLRCYLGHPAERDKMSQKAYERALAEHTYGHRIAEMLKIMNLN
jgi:spore maturation protein CgeB